MVEEVVLTQPKAKVILTPKAGIAGHFMRGFFRYSLLGQLFVTPFTESLKQTSVEAGDVKDAMDKVLKLQELILTNKNLILFYRKGLVSKKDKVITLLLEYAKEAIGKKRLTTRFINVNFLVPSKEKPVEFELRLIGLKDPDMWLRELNRIVSSFRGRG